MLHYLVTNAVTEYAIIIICVAVQLSQPRTTVGMQQCVLRDLIHEIPCVYRTL